MSTHQTALRNIKSKENDFLTRLESSTEQTKNRLVAGQRRVKQMLRQTEMNTKKYPWRALGIAALSGFILGGLRVMLHRTKGPSE